MPTLQNCRNIKVSLETTPYKKIWENVQVPFVFHNSKSIKSKSDFIIQWINVPAPTQAERANVELYGK